MVAEPLAEGGGRAVAVSVRMTVAGSSSWRSADGHCNGEQKLIHIARPEHRETVDEGRVSGHSISFS
jgi:hypothetical protein